MQHLPESGKKSNENLSDVYMCMIFKYQKHQTSCFSEKKKCFRFPKPQTHIFRMQENAKDFLLDFDNFLLLLMLFWNKNEEKLQLLILFMFQSISMLRHVIRLIFRFSRNHSKYQQK